MELRVVFFYILSFFLSFFVINIFKNHLAAISTIFNLFQFCIFSILFITCIPNRKSKIFITALSTLNLLFLLIIHFQLKSKFEFVSILTDSLLIFIYTLMFFYNEMNSSNNYIIYTSHKFWIVLACVIFYAGTLFVFLYTSDMKDKMYSALWNVVNLIFEIVKNTCFSIAFLLARKPKQNILAAEYDDTNMTEKPF